MKITFLANIVAAGCLAILGATMTPRASAAELAPIAALLNEQTCAILALDVERFDVKTAFDKSQAWLAKRSPDSLFSADAIREATQAIAGMRAMPEKWAQDFLQAGGREVYALAYAADGPQFILAIPMAKTANREALENLFEPMLRQAQLGAIGKQLKGDCLIMGNQDVIARLVSGKSTQRPDLESALASQGPRALKLALAPTADQRRVVQEMLPAIPVGTNQVSTAVLVRGLSWCAVGIDYTPDATAKLILQAASDTAGQELDALVRTFKRDALAPMEDAEMKATVEKVFAMLTPTLEASRLTLGLDEKALEEVFLKMIGPMLVQAKGRSFAIAAMNNVKQIVLGCRMFRDDNKAWPDQLKVLLDKNAYLQDPQTLQDPRNPQREIGFEYLVPGKDSANYPAASHILIHQIFDAWPTQGLCIGFLDGHAEIMMSKTRFDTLLAETKARNAVK